MKIKVKSVDVQLSDGQTVKVHEPLFRDLAVFLKSLPALSALDKAFAAAQGNDSGIVGIPSEIPDNIVDGLNPLLAIMTDVEVEDIRNLPLMDGIALMKGFQMFAPKNPQAVQPEITAETPEA